MEGSAARNRSLISLIIERRDRAGFALANRGVERVIRSDSNCAGIAVGRAHQRRDVATGVYLPDGATFVFQYVNGPGTVDRKTGRTRKLAGSRRTIGVGSAAIASDGGGHDSELNIGGNRERIRADRRGDFRGRDASWIIGNRCGERRCEDAVLIGDSARRLRRECRNRIRQRNRDTGECRTRGITHRDGERGNTLLVSRDDETALRLVGSSHRDRSVDRRGCCVDRVRRRIDGVRRCIDYDDARVESAFIG